MTLDIYSHVAPGLQEAAAKRFDEIVNLNIDNKALTPKRQEGVNNEIQ